MRMSMHTAPRRAQHTQASHHNLLLMIIYEEDSKVTSLTDKAARVRGRTASASGSTIIYRIKREASKMKLPSRHVYRSIRVLGHI